MIKTIKKPNYTIVRNCDGLTFGISDLIRIFQGEKYLSQVTKIHGFDRSSQRSVYPQLSNENLS